MATIYIVEDDVNIREIERYALKNSGFQVEVWGRPFQAVREQSPGSDLVRYHASE